MATRRREEMKRLLEMRRHEMLPVREEPQSDEETGGEEP
jgi:hypothetical protein